MITSQRQTEPRNLANAETAVQSSESPSPNVQDDADKLLDIAEAAIHVTQESLSRAVSENSSADGEGTNNQQEDETQNSRVERSSTSNAQSSHDTIVVQRAPEQLKKALKPVQLPTKRKRTPAAPISRKRRETSKASREEMGISGRRSSQEEPRRQESSARLEHGNHWWASGQS